MLKLGTRGSALALWQARTVAGLLEARGSQVELVIIRTAGDRLQDAPLQETGGKRLFVKEIEEALLRGDVDLAVHSAKDMPALLPEGLDIAAVLPREDPRDALVLPGSSVPGDMAAALAHLGETPAVGTSSIRRVAQLSTVLPRARFGAIRGNVDTRLRTLDAGEFDAIVLASAGMRRLGFASRISAPIPLESCVPAPGQGIVAIEIRTGDRVTRARLEAITDAKAAVSLVAERTVVAALGGGCQLPLGAISLHRDDALVMHGIVTAPDGRRAVRARVVGAPGDPAGAGRRLADDLARGGAVEILEAVRAGGAPPAASGDRPQGAAEQP